MNTPNSFTILVTGSAGFIGSNLIKALAAAPGAFAAGETELRIIGIDNVNAYYDVSLKESRLADVQAAVDVSLAAGHRISYHFCRGSIADRQTVFSLFASYRPDIVVNLAAQAGVRYSITHPDEYMESNLMGFYTVIEACRHYPVSHLVFASSSSVYGSNKKVPYSTDDKVDNPVSLYAATKKSNELIAHCYAKLYGIPVTGLRFFTVYGPAGRPDMAYFGFTNKIVRGETIQIFNHGDMKRDFTYIDDVVTGVLAVMKRPPAPNEDGVPYRLYNIGNHHPEDLLFFVDTLEKSLKEAGVIAPDHIVRKEFLPMQPGDVYQTYADTEPLRKDFGFQPSTPLAEGLRRFAQWYRTYYRDSLS